MIQKIPFNRISFTEEAHNQFISICSDVLKSGCLIHGPQHKKFEHSFANYCGVDYTIGVANGTDAIEIALRASGIREGDEVVLQPNAGFYSSTALFTIGAVPVYADINEHNLQINIDSVVRCLSPKTKAIIMTHLYGKMGDVENMRNLSDRNNILLIEDCAQSHGAKFKGKKAGAWGDVSTFSFYPTKNLGAIGDAGAICTSSSKIANEVGHLRQYGWSSKYNVSKIGRNSRLDEVQAAVLNYKILSLDADNEKRRKIVKRYAKACSGNLKMIHGMHDLEYVGHLAIASHPARDLVIDYLKHEGIETAIHYPILDHLQQCIQSFRYRKDILINAEKTNKEILSLPCYPTMLEDEVQYICNVLSKIRL